MSLACSPGRLSPLSCLLRCCFVTTGDKGFLIPLVDVKMIKCAADRLMRGGDSLQKRYVRSVQGMKALEHKGYKLWAMSYFVYGKGPALYIMAK